MSFQDDQIQQARENIARAKQTEQKRIAKLVEEASVSTNAWAAEQEAERARIEQERERKRQEREQQREAAAREAFQSSYEAVGGDPALFEEMYRRHRSEEAARAIEVTRARARIS